MNLQEQYWIDFYDSFNNGLNCNEGGRGNTGYKPTQETKDKISKKLSGVSKSEEFKAKVKMTTLMQAREPKNKGMIYTEQQKSNYKRLGRKPNK